MSVFSIREFVATSPDRTQFGVEDVICMLSCNNQWYQQSIFTDPFVSRFTLEWLEWLEFTWHLSSYWAESPSNTTKQHTHTNRQWPLVYVWYLLLLAKLFVLLSSSVRPICKGSISLMTLSVSVFLSSFDLCRAATTQDTQWWWTRWSTTFTSSPVVSSTPRSPPSLVCNAHRFKHTHTHSGFFPRPCICTVFLINWSRLLTLLYSLYLGNRHSEGDQLESEPDCSLHHIHSSAVTSLANGVLLFLSGLQPSAHLHSDMHSCMICRCLVTFLLFLLWHINGFLHFDSNT